MGGHSHPHRQRMNDLSYEDLYADWKECTERLENILGHSISTCSLPCGYSSQQILQVLNSLGYEDVYTSEASEELSYVNGLRLHGRYGIRESMSDDDYVLSIVSSPWIRKMIKIRKCFLSIVILLGGAYISIREHLLQKRLY